ncbi:efflux transporter outer membrane subunit [Methylogaea oryzae]|nr:efflux transporter outer membrane subunit [Methylogaea oryzae]
MRTQSLLMLLPLLGGCALLPEDGSQAQFMDTPQLEQTVSDAGHEVERSADAWPHARWWQVFRNPGLDRLMDTALQGNPDLRIAADRLRMAQSLADYQAAEMLPSVGASLAVRRWHVSEHDIFGPLGGQTVNAAYLDPVVFRYHLDLWGKDRAALDSALGHAKAQAAELAVSRLVLSTNLARAYFRLGAAAEETRLAGDLLRRAEAVLELARVRWEKGLAAMDPVRAAEQGVAAARQRLAALQKESELLRHRLAALAGQGPDWGKGIAVADGGLHGPFPLPERLPLELLAHRPDVAAARWRAEAAAQRVKVAKANFYPDVNLVGFAGLRSINLKDLFLSHGSSLAYSIGPTVTLPLFEGGRLEAELSHGEAGYDAAVDAYNAALLGAVQQVADALAEWRDSHAQDAAQEQAVRAAEQALALAQRRDQAGLNTRDELLAADAALLEQRLKLSRLQGEHQQAAVALIEALGGGFDSNDIH